MKNVKINKGNYSLDTNERELMFEQAKSMGWESLYKEYRDNWSNYPKNTFVSEYPLLVDLELSSVCNLKCPMCYTITDEFKNKIKNKFMDFNLYIKIMDEIAGHVPSIRLSLRGEPTLYPKLIECIEYAKNKGIKEVSFLTNGSKLTEEYFEKIMLAGADWITISIDGLYDTYESIRKPLKFIDTFEKVKMIKRLKQKHSSKKPVIKIQAIWPSIRKNSEEFYNKFVEYVDLIAFNPLIDYLDNDDESQILYEDNFLCPQLYQRIIITADGNFLICSNDENQTEIIGNAYNETVYDVWHSKRLNDIRKLHIEIDGFKNLNVCKKCYLPRRTIENEKIIVNEREIIIKNYENRVQNIGQ
jgi:radical SAM protein with 4Fe4S-binding SPASM domain